MRGPKSERKDAATLFNGHFSLQNVDRLAFLGRLPLVIGYVTLLALWVWAGFPDQSGWFMTNTYGLRPSSDETQGEYDPRSVEPTLGEPWNQVRYFVSFDCVYNQAFQRADCDRQHFHHGSAY